MTVTIKINTDTPVGKRLENELHRYPECVEFIESTVVSDAIPEGYAPLKDGFDQVKNQILINSDAAIGKKLIHKLESHRQVVKIEYPYPTDTNGDEIESISATESAKLAFSRLGEKYNRTFDNKYTQ